MHTAARLRRTGPCRLRAIIRLGLASWLLSLLVPVLGAGPAEAGIPPGHADRIFRVKFSEGTGVDPRSLLPADLAAVVQKLDPLFTLPKTKLKDLKEKGDDKLKTEKGDQFVPLPDLELWYEVRLTPDADPETSLAAFQALPFVEWAGAAPLAGELPAAGNYTSNQAYLYGSASGGIEADYAWAFAGGTGSGITIYDVEYSWNQNHEDVTKARDVTPLLNAGDAAVDPGALTNPLQATSHGTAVLGMLVADRDVKGVTGIAPGAGVGLAPANTRDLGYNVGNAVLLALAHGQAGDVILIEQQIAVCGLGPGFYGPSEGERAVFDAIRTATANGFVVVEAAGNGSVDLDQAACASTFGPGAADSGAIIVGAGNPPVPGPDRQRSSFSSYGSRVDVQGWGSGIYTTGKGDLYGYTLTQRLEDDFWYTKSFNGTSGAAPMVAAAAAIVEGIARSQYGRPLLPSQVRDLLVNTGDAQQYPAGTPNSEHIGPRPNLRSILAVSGLPQPDTAIYVTGDGAAGGDGFCGIDSCTLADAITAANRDASPTDIYLPAGATYTLGAVDNSDPIYGSNGLPVITTAITIHGNGSTIERSGAAGTPDFRLFQVAAEGVLTLTQTTLRNGSLLGSRGGTLLNLGTATVGGSTITGGSAAAGGAIANEGTLTVANSTLTSNTAAAGGGAIEDRGVLRLLSSTLAGNSAPAGANVSTSGAPMLKNTLLLKEAGAANCLGAFSSSSTSNLADDASCGGSATVKTAGEIALAGLADNGGPTPTMALGSASAAIDRGNASACKESGVANLDQRGYDRLVDGDGDGVFTCDIGAYEYGSSVPLPPPPALDTEPPAVALFLTPEAADGDHGWYRGPVTPAVAFMDYESRVVQVRCVLDPATLPANFDDLPDEVCPFIGAGTPVGSDGRHVLYAAAEDEYDNKGALDEEGNLVPLVSIAFRLDATPPVITCPEAGPFLYRSGARQVGPAGVSDAVSGVDEGTPDTVLIGAVDTGSIGRKTVTFTAFDVAGNSASLSCRYNVIYDFGGYYPPVKPAPALNEATAGSAIPVKWSLAGDQGLEVVAPGYPVSQPVACDTQRAAGSPQTTTPTGRSGLSYDPTTGWYNYVWKTDRRWAGSCRALAIELVDGTRHVTYVQFK